MPNLHIFNPDTDYALASDRRYYTPPAYVTALRKRLALLPALYAREGDSILLLDSPDIPLTSLEYYDICRDKSIDIVSLCDCHDGISSGLELTAEPWGWNRNIRQILCDNFPRLKGIPDKDAIGRLRNLSHRRTTIEFLTYLKESLPNEIEIPVEINNPEVAMQAYRENRSRFFKAPWSSSGRGIILTDDLEPKHVEPWIRGIIRRQGSVMMEKAYWRSLDFATEWRCDRGSVSFLGYSVFETSRRGKYHSNERGSQEDLIGIIRNSCDSDPEEMTELQKRAIEKIIAPKYDGYLGVDMLATHSGAINPCVEINLRHTMGMINLIH